MNYIGIDPGSSSGYIAVLTNDDQFCYRMSTGTLRDMFEFLRDANERECIAVLEVVHGMPGMSVKAISTFMKNSGHIEMALTANAIPYIGVSPQKWMKHFNMKKDKSESKTEWKKRLRDIAEQRLPNAPINRENADAFLIALYCKETYNN